MKVDVDSETIHKLGIHHEAVAIIVYDKDAKILFIKRNKNKLGGGKWEIPATHVSDFGYFKDGLCCIEREIGIKDIQLDYLGKFNYYCELKTKTGKMIENETVHVLLAKYNGEELQTKNEHIEEIIWFTIEELIDRINKNSDEFCFWSLEGICALTDDLIIYFQKHKL